MTPTTTEPLPDPTPKLSPTQTASERLRVSLRLLSVLHGQKDEALQDEHEQEGDEQEQEEDGLLERDGA